TSKGRRLLGLIGADIDESDKFFIDGRNHLEGYLRSKYAVQKGAQRNRATLPAAERSDGLTLAFWYRQITSGEMIVTDERGQWAADIVGTPAPAWVSRALELKGTAA